MAEEPPAPVLFWQQPCAAFRKCHTPSAQIKLLPGEPRPDEMPTYVKAELIVHGWWEAAGRWVCGSHPSTDSAPATNEAAE